MNSHYYYIYRERERETDRRKEIIFQSECTVLIHVQKKIEYERKMEKSIDQKCLNQASNQTLLKC
jgi:outer membrane protein assembly factor BamE (lipoprotein component of BamABCDE complex)